MNVRGDSVPSEARVPEYTEARGFTPEGSQPDESLQSRVCTDGHEEAGDQVACVMTVKVLSSSQTSQGAADVRVRSESQ